MAPPRGEAERARRYEAAERELAYRVWRQSAANLAETLRRLDSEHDWPLAKQTLADWRDGFGWVARAAAEDAEAARRQRADRLDRSAMLAGLDLQIEAYEGAFAAARAAGEAPDPRAVGAYASLLRLRLDTLRDIEAGRGLDRGDIAADVIEWLSAWLGERYPQHAPIFAEVLSAAAGPLALAFAAAK